MHGQEALREEGPVITYISDRLLGPEEALKLNTALLSPAQRKTFVETHDLDFALALGGAERYRVNLMFHKDGAAGSYRIVPKQVKTMQELGFEKHLETLKRLLSYHNGLVLITGPGGLREDHDARRRWSAYLNDTRKDHIITVEDPIEVVQKSKGRNVTQRQVGDHTRTFFSALKGALREDPDIIVIGELRDLETIEMAVSAAETGHLVIGTMHTSDAATTLNRLLDVFPASQQTQIRASVAESLRGIVCQRLLPRRKGRGLVMACEILVNNVAISNLVREGKTTGLRNTMETGRARGDVPHGQRHLRPLAGGQGLQGDRPRQHLKPRAPREASPERAMAEIDTLLRIDGGQGRLRPAPATVGQPPKARISGLHPGDRGQADSTRRPWSAAQGDRPGEALEGLPRKQGPRPRPRDSRLRAIPRELPLQPLGPGRRVPPDPREDPLLRGAEAAGGDQEALPPERGARRRHGARPAAASRRRSRR